MLTHFLNLRVLLPVFFFSSVSYGQLSSCSPSYTIETDSLSESTQLIFAVTFDDVSDVGGVEISAYNAETGNFIVEYLGSRDELHLSGHLTNDHLQFPFFEIEKERQYRFEINPINLYGAYIGLTVLTTTLQSYFYV